MTHILQKNIQMGCLLQINPSCVGCTVFLCPFDIEQTYLTTTKVKAQLSQLLVSCGDLVHKVKSEGKFQRRLYTQAFKGALHHFFLHYIAYLQHHNSGDAIFSTLLKPLIVYVL